MTDLPLWIIPLFPLLGVILLGAIAVISAPSEKGPSEGFVGALSVMFPVLSFISVILLSFSMPESGVAQTLCNWIDIPMLNVDIGFMFDSLTRIMLLFVTGISSLIALYSIGYMHGDRGFTRFFAYINLFLFSMIVLVLSDNLMLTFFGWEGVGLCSYLLIGFWNKDISNCKAANKAFIVNRVGDIGFLLGMLCLASLGGSGLLNYEALNKFIAMLLSSGQIEIIAPFLIITCALFFIGCTGKSAQIPLLTWLPDAMAGPTPVSALIHAATMVTAGVYLLARMSSLFAAVPDIMFVVLVVGSLTAFWAAVAGLFQNDIKKVLAYSTISQLGYMFMAAGACAFDASIFHVFTHAFFKAALFLGAGAIIHSLSGEQDMRRMGGLIKKTPITACVMIFAFLAIIGFPGFAGFWSKDLILERIYTNAPYGGYFYALGLLTAVITAIYMGRLIIMTFFGEYRGPIEQKKHIHEAPACMLIPMVVLAFGAVFSGYLWADILGIKFFENMLLPVVGAAQANIAHVGMQVNSMTFACLGTLAALFGIGIAYAIYANKRLPRIDIKCASTPVGYKAKWTFFFDYVHSIFVKATNVVAFIADMIVDKILQAAQWTVGAIAEILGDGVSVFQVRRVRVQLALSLLGVAILIAIVIKTGGLF